MSKKDFKRQWSCTGPSWPLCFIFVLICIKGGYLDFLHLTELKNIYITEIHILKQTNNQ